MLQINATYDPSDDKLRLRASERLPQEIYAKVKAAGFGWAPKQDLFFAVWTPEREDLALELAGEIGDEDTTLVERAEQRAERFADYHEKRAIEAEHAREAVSKLADGIPLGQPILVGHHSERHARKDAEKIENGMRKAVNLWKASQYWERRAAGVLQHAERKERADVVARRIKGLEADERKHVKALAESEKFVKAWGRLDDLEFLKLKAGGATTPIQKAVYLADCDWRVAHLSTSEIRDGKITPEQARDQALAAHESVIAHHGRWLEHTRNRLAYERVLLADAGGLPVDKTKPEVGGAIRCWCCKGAGVWMLIQKVNKVSVTVSDTWGHGDLFPRKIKLDEITGVMAAAEVAAKIAAGAAVKSDDGRCIVVQDPLPKDTRPTQWSDVLVAAALFPQPMGVTPPAKPAGIAAMESSLKAGVQVAVAPQLFPTPPTVADEMLELAKVREGIRFLEPSAGTGNLIQAIWRKTRDCGDVRVVAVEINQKLAMDLESRASLARTAGSLNKLEVWNRDFLTLTPSDLGYFNRILMNPPFDGGIDVEHILHAMKFLKPGGILVGICAVGPRQSVALKSKADIWKELPPGTFAGTNVRSILFTIQK